MDRNSIERPISLPTKRTFKSTVDQADSPNNKQTVQIDQINHTSQTRLYIFSAGSFSFSETERYIAMCSLLKLRKPFCSPLTSLSLHRLSSTLSAQEASEGRSSPFIHPSAIVHPNALIAQVLSQLSTFFFENLIWN
jgi:hypothetical protein